MAKRSRALARAIKAVGGLGPFARKLGISSQAVIKWKKIPEGRLSQIERITGVPRQELRPDLYPRDIKEDGHAKCVANHF